MSKFYKLLAMLSVTVPAALLAQPTEQRFTRNGQTYVYTVSTDAQGRRVLDGRRLPSGSAFHLVVANGHVDGISGGQPVAFRVPAKRAVAVASR